MLKNEKKETVEVSEKEETQVPELKGKKARIAKKEGVVKKITKVKTKKFVLDFIDELRSYEFMFIVDADLNDAKREERIAFIKKTILSEGGKITFEDFTWGVRELCYRINKKWHGYYFVLNVELKASSILEMKKTFDLDLEIMRYLIIKLPKNFEAVKYEDVKDKYDIESFEEKLAKKQQKRSASRAVKVAKKVELKEENIIEKKVEKIEKLEKKEEKKPVTEEKKVEEKKEEEKAPEVKTEEKKKETEDHLKELNDKLDKLLLSDDL